MIALSYVMSLYVEQLKALLRYSEVGTRALSSTRFFVFSKEMCNSYSWLKNFTGSKCHSRKSLLFSVVSETQIPISSIQYFIQNSQNHINLSRIEALAHHVKTSFSLKAAFRRQGKTRCICRMASFNLRALSSFLLYAKSHNAAEHKSTTHQENSTGKHISGSRLHSEE